MKPGGELGACKEGVGSYFEDGPRCTPSLHGNWKRPKKRDPDGVLKIMQVLTDYFGPGAADSAYQKVARLLQSKRTAQTMDEYLARSDLLSRKAGPQVADGWGLPGDIYAGSLHAESFPFPF